MKAMLLPAILSAAFVAPASAQETSQLPRFDALEQQQQATEQNRFDSLERQRQRDRSTFPGSGVSGAERGITDLDYQLEFERLRLQGELERAQVQRERDLANAALPNRRIAPFSSLVIADPGQHFLPPAPPGQYYARLDGRFVLVDRTSELVVRVLDPQPTDPSADVPVGPRPPVQKPAPVGRPFADDARAALQPPRN